MMVRLAMRLGGLLWVMLATVACVGLGGEPSIISTRMPAPPATATPILPEVVDMGYSTDAPDLTEGARIYVDHCAGCHGDTGAGDGPVALNAGLVPGSFLTPMSARSQTPHEWFSTITNGRIENLMPPWKDALTEEERWAVAMYTYTLHVTDDTLALGETLYQECAECHGILGKGDGPEADLSASGVKDLTDQGAMVTLSDESMYRMVTQGFEEVMPSYADRFTEDERWAVVAYARSLSLTSSAPITTQANGTMDFTGTVTLFGSEAVPAGLSVGLRGFDPETGEPADLGMLMPAPVNTDGSYVLEDVAYNPNLAYFTTVNYEGYPFASAPAQALGEAGVLTLDVILYDVTSSLTDVTATAWVTQITAYEGQLEIIAVMQVQNLSETRMFSTGEFLPDGRPIAFTIPVPDGATLLEPSNASQIIAQDGLTMIDTQPLPPRGQKLINARYTLPYTLGEPLILPTDLTVAGVVRVLVRPTEMSIASDMLPPLGEEFIGGEFYKAYGEQLALREGTTLEIVLNGQPLAAAAADSTTQTVSPSSQGLTPSAALTAEVLTPILALLGLGIVGTTLALILRRPQRKS